MREPEPAQVHPGQMETPDVVDQACLLVARGDHQDLEVQERALALLLMPARGQGRDDLARIALHGHDHEVAVGEGAALGQEVFPDVEAGHRPLQPLDDNAQRTVRQKMVRPVSFVGHDMPHEPGPDLRRR